MVQYTGAWWEPTNKGSKDGFISRFDLTLISYGIDGKDENGFFNLFPNPVDQIVNFEADLKNQTDVILSITNMTGQKLFEKHEKNCNGFFKTQVDVSGLSSGIYIVELNVSGKIYVKKLVKQ